MDSLLLLLFSYLYLNQQSPLLVFSIWDVYRERDHSVTQSNYIWPSTFFSSNCIHRDVLGGKNPIVYTYRPRRKCSPRNSNSMKRKKRNTERLKLSSNQPTHVVVCYVWRMKRGWTCQRVSRWFAFDNEYRLRRWQPQEYSLFRFSKGNLYLHQRLQWWRRWPAPTIITWKKRKKNTNR